MERTLDPTRTRQVIGAQNPTRLSAKVLMSRMTVYSILIVTYSISAQSSWCLSFENCCPGNRLATTRHIPFNKAENIEKFIQSTTCEPDPDPVLISAYVPDTRPETDFLCSFHPETIFIIDISSKIWEEGSWFQF